MLKSIDPLKNQVNVEDLDMHVVVFYKDKIIAIATIPRLTRNGEYDFQIFIYFVMHTITIKRA